MHKTENGIKMGNKQKQLSDGALVLAYRIRKARLTKFKTVKEAAALFPVEKNLWGFLETARVTPQERTMEKLSAFLDVSIDFFHQKPENLDSEKKRFLVELMGFKDYYKIVPSATNDNTQTSSEPQPESALAVFLQITRLIADAQASVHASKLSREAYETHMQMIADMVKVSPQFMRK